jgi:HK97 gp10 family phage protein
MAVTTPAAMAAEFNAKAYNAPRQVGGAVIAAAALIQRQARQNVPVDTGFLRTTITRESTRSATGATSVVGPEAMYGAFVENGTRHMAPQPYLLPAALDVEPQFQQALADIVGFEATGSIGVASALTGQMVGGMDRVEV